MMKVWVMPVTMNHLGVPMEMRVRLAGRILGQVLVLMVFIVHMPVLVLHRFMDMIVFMTFREMEPHPQSHQGTREE